MLQTLSPTRDELTVAMQTGEPHLRPLWLACRDFDVCYALVTRGSGAFDLARAKPRIVVIGDDDAGVRSAGPDGFDRRSVEECVKRASVVLVLSGAPIVSDYTAAAYVPAILRDDVVIIETQYEQEAAWLAFSAHAAGPDTMVTTSSHVIAGRA